MQYRLSDLIDLPAVRTMVDSLYAAAGIPVGMIDVDGTVLLAAGWQDICTKFHRVHPATARRCRESDAYIDRYLTGDAELPSCGFIEYTCQNGLIDACMPVIIEGNHLANLYLGQFLYQPPDEAFFRAQALEHGFDEEVYLEALRRVPIFSRERVEEILAFHSHFLDVLIRMGLERLRYLTANRELEFREAFEKLIANISTRFVELPSEEINQGIDLALQELGEFIAADRSYVFLRTPGGMHASCTNEVCAEGVPAAREEKQAVNLSDLPWYLEKIRSQKVLYVPRVDDLPSEAQTEKELWQAHGIRTLAGVPIYVAEQQIGLLGFDSVHAEKSWDDDTLNRLKTVGEIFGSAIARERSERALRESEEWFRTIFEASAVGMATFSAGSKIDHVNPALCRLLGYSQAELQQLTVADVTHPEDLELTARQIDEATAGQRRHIEMEKRYLRKNGSTVWGQVSVAYLPQAGHGPMRSVAMIQDITERKEVERRLQESEKRLALALQVSNQGVWDLNTETGETYFSSRYYQMLGYESDELEASYESWAELLHPDDREQAIATAEDFFDNGRSYMAEFRMRTKDGAYRHILSCGEAVERTREGQPLRLLGTHMDITERVEYRRQLEKSRASLAEAQRIARVGSWDTDLETGDIFWSDEMYRLVGQEPAAFTPTAEQLFELIHSDDREDMQRAFDRALTGERAYRLEHRVILADGSVRHFDVQGEVQCDAAGKPVRIVGTTLDITERKVVEEDLQTTHRRLADIIDFLPDATFVIDREKRVVAWNRAVEEMTGVPKEEVLGQGDYAYALPFWGERRPILIDLVESDDRDLETFYGVARTEDGRVMGEAFLPPAENRAGKYLWGVASPLYDTEGNVIGAIESIRDISKRKLAVEAVRESERRLATLMANLPGMAYRCRNDRAWTMDFVSEGCRDLTGYLPEDLLDSHKVSYAHIIHPDDRERVWHMIKASLVKKRPFQLEYRIRTAGGKQRWVAELGRGIFSEGGEMLFLEGIITDITERKQVEESLRRSEGEFKRVSQEFRTLLDGIPDVIVLLSPDLEVVWANQAAAALRPSSTAFLSGETCYSAWHNRTTPCGICPAVETFRSGEIVERTFAKGDGRSWHLKAIPLKDSAGGVINVIEIASDITEQVRLREEAERSSRLAALGELAAGVAHEINNPNALVRVNASILAKAAPVGLEALEERYRQDGDFTMGEWAYSELRDEIPLLLSEMLDASRRIAHIVEDMKDFSRPTRAQQLGPFDMNEAVEAALRLAGSTVRKATDHFVADYGAGLPAAYGDFQGTVQVTVNLVTNAYHALQGKDRGIRIRTRFDEDRNRVVLEVRDEGVGIAPEDLPRITEPFYTSRREEGGSGLGLSISSRIAMDMGAKLAFSSTVGKGTTATLEVPVFQEKD